MTDDDTDKMRSKILEFGTFMKENLGFLKTKQKGHLLLFEAPEFAEKFRTCSFFLMKLLKHIIQYVMIRRKELK